jgi:hypothetical protein
MCMFSARASSAAKFSSGIETPDRQVIGNRDQDGDGEDLSIYILST